MDSHDFYRKRNCIFRHALSKSARMLKKKTCTGALRREKNLVKTLHEKQMAALLLYSSKLVQKSAKNKKRLARAGMEKKSRENVALKRTVVDGSTVLVLVVVVMHM